MCDKVVSKTPFMLKYFFGKFKTQKIWHKTINSFLSTSKVVSDCFATNWFFFVDVDSNIITFPSNYMVFNTINFTNISLNDDNFDKNDPENITDVRLIAWRNRYKQHRTCKK